MANYSKGYYPPVGFYFKVNFLFSGGASSETSFKEVSGLSVDASPEEVVEGGELKFRHKLPTTPKYSNLVLKRGLATGSTLRNWVISGVQNFKFVPIIVNIQLLNEKGEPLKTWSAHNVWPVKWEVSNFDSMTNELVIESLELAYDYFDMKN